jgi:hypothetical protein
LDISFRLSAHPNNQDIELLRFFGGLLQGFGCPSPLPRGMAQPVDHARGDKDHNAYNDLK